MSYRPLLTRATFCAALTASLSAHAAPLEGSGGATEASAQAAPPGSPENAELPPDNSSGAPTSEPLPPHLTLRQPTYAASSARLAAIDERILRLQDQRSEYSLATPIIVLGIGYAAVGYSLWGLLVEALGDSEPCDSYDACQNNGASTGLLLGIGAAGGVVMVGGGLWLVHRIGERRSLGKEITGLRQEREQLLVAPRSAERDQLGDGGSRLVGVRGFRGVKLTLEF